MINNKMKKFKIIIPAAILLAILVIGLGIGWEEARAVDKLKLQVPLGTVEFLDHPYLVGYLEALFKYFVGITAILAAVAMMYAGYQWIFASGNQTKISSAKQTVGNAAVGLILALTAYIILNTLNPRIVQLEFPDTTIPTVEFGTVGYSACSGGNVVVTDAEGHCLPASQIPCNVLCIDYNEIDPGPPVYGQCNYGVTSQFFSCGNSSEGDVCVTATDGNTFGTYCLFPSNNACFIENKDYTQNANFECKDTVEFANAAANGFDDNTWSGADGAESPGEGNPRFMCGKLYFERGLWNSVKGFFGIAYGNEGNEEGHCIINHQAGHQFTMDYATFESTYCEGGNNCKGEVGCWNEAWIIQENGVNTRSGCGI